ncbi:MAG TPA: hypothetical protein VL523_07205 [Terriglobia bacterium]|nr:hypothetical protein [Terriglobia bacterium]
MKRILTTLATLALALSLGAPAFAATGMKGAKGQTPAQTTSAKTKAKPAGKVKKSTKPARKTAAKSAKTAAPKSK